MLKKYHLQRIDVLSVARIYLVMGLALGLICGAAVMIFWYTYEPVKLGPTLLTSFILICVSAGTGACIIGFLAWLYNLIAGITGGIAIDLSEESLVTPASAKKEDKILL